MGVLLYAMLVGGFPFVGGTKEELSRHILRGHFTTPSHVSREPESLLRSMLLIDPNRRDTIERVRTSRWLNAPGEEEISVEHQRQGKPDEEVLCKLHDMGVSGQSVLDSVRQGRHDHIHATYQLLLRRRQQAHSAAPNMDAADVEVSTGWGNAP